MSSVKSLVFLHCAKCGGTTLHDSNVCQARGCGTVNRDSGNPPVPKPYPRFNTIRAKNFDPALEEAGRARRAARAARHHHTSRGRA